MAHVPAAYKENSVRAWVAEHYGHSSDSGIPESAMNIYENAATSAAAAASDGNDVYQNCAELRTHPHVHPSHPSGNPAHPHGSQTLSARMSTVSSASASSSRTLPSSASGASGKRLPPPPPKRSDTTHLSSRIH